MQTAEQKVRTQTTDPEIDLMLRVQKDEPGAFTELIQEYWPRVFGRFYRSFANRQDAEDLTQEVFLRLFRARKRYQPSAKFNTWLFHISQNVIRNALRSQRRRPIMSLGMWEENGDLPAPFKRLHSEESDSPSHPMERRELARVIRDAVSDLGDRQRKALELHQFHHHSYAEVARHMGMSPEAAKSLLYRARIQLRHHLQKKIRE